MATCRKFAPAARRSVGAAALPLVATTARPALLAARYGSTGYATISGTLTVSMMVAKPARRWLPRRYTLPPTSTPRATL